MTKRLKITAKDAKTPFGDLEGVSIRVGKIVSNELDEEMGPTPFPKIAELRAWDRKLLRRHEPYYAPLCDLCCLCTYGKCDLSEGKCGACGLDIKAQTARIVLLACCIGVSSHASHGEHLVEELIHQFGPDTPIYLGKGVDVEAPNIRLVTGRKVETLGDLEEILDYVNSQIVHLVASAHTGQEGDYMDYESKSLHAGMLDHVAMEAADIAQVAAFESFPKADPEAPLAEIGAGTIDSNKTMILVIGHNAIPTSGVMDYIDEHGLWDKIEIGGICCTAHDTSRMSRKAKVVGAISQQLRFIRAGMADVITVDEQCIRSDVVEEAKKVGTPIIATTDKACRNLPDRTEEDPNDVIADLVSGKEPGALIFDRVKLGKIAVETALAVAPQRKKRGIVPSLDDVKEILKDCTGCRSCHQNCPQDNPIDEAFAKAKEGDFSMLEMMYDDCIACNRCTYACSKHIPVLNVILSAGRNKLDKEKAKMRVGRGPISDAEIRNVGAPIVFGEIPGIIAMVGCANYPDGIGALGIMAEEFLKRNYIVVTSGCNAMDLAFWKTEDGELLYEAYHGGFDAGGLVNVGSCVSNAHITGAAIKVASIFARRNLAGNYEEVADYIYNRVGAVGVAWGAMSQKAASIAAGCQRLGIPVIVGPHGWKYRRLYLGDADNDDVWQSIDARTGEKVYTGPTPEHLMYVGESIEESIVACARLVLRPNDTVKGRTIKLAHYCDISKKYLGTIPQDIHRFIRSEKEIPLSFADEIREIMQKNNWQPNPIPDPTIVHRLVRTKKE